MTKTNLAVPNDKISAFWEKWQVTELSLFGSALRDDFRPDSDVDVLVVFAVDARRTLFDMVRMEDELKLIFNRKVDLVSRRGIEQSANYPRRRAILGSARAIYVA